MEHWRLREDERVGERACTGWQGVRTCNGQVDDLAHVADNQVLTHAEPFLVRQVWINKMPWMFIVGCTSLYPSPSLLPPLPSPHPSVPAPIQQLGDALHSAVGIKINRLFQRALQRRILDPAEESSHTRPLVNFLGHLAARQGLGCILFSLSLFLRRGSRSKSDSGGSGGCSNGASFTFFNPCLLFIRGRATRSWRLCLCLLLALAGLDNCLDYLGIG